MAIQTTLGPLTGQIKTTRPSGAAFGADWAKLAKHYPMFQAACREQGFSNARVFAGMALVESDAAHFRADGSVVVRPSDSYDQYPAVGMFQVKPHYHQWRVPDANAYDLWDNMRLAAAIMAAGEKETGSWQEGLRKLYFPGADVGTGTSQSGYVSCLAAIEKEMTGAATSVKPVIPTVISHVPRPAIVEQLVKKPEGAGWSDYGPRDMLLAIIIHNVLGNAKTTGGYFGTYDTSQANGGHGWNALTDWGVCNVNDGPDWDGKILKWNDPDSNRSPWASGGEGTPHGDGPAFIALCRKLNRNINQVSEAIEVSRLSNTGPVSAKCKQGIINLAAYRVDVKGKIPWNIWPKNPHGIQMILTHDEMGKAQCNALDIISDIIDGVRDLLKEYNNQGTTVPAPAMPAVPMEPIVIRWLDKIRLPEGIKPADLAERFGSSFDPAGPISYAWAVEGLKTGRWPKLLEAEPADANGRDFVFDGGLWIRADRAGVRVVKEAT